MGKIIYGPKPTEKLVDVPHKMYRARDNHVGNSELLQKLQSSRYKVFMELIDRILCTAKPHQFNPLLLDHFFAVTILTKFCVF